MTARAMLFIDTLKTLSVWEKWFVLILVVNLIITIIYLIVSLLFWKKDNKRGCWIRAFVMLLCPITGALMLLVGYICFLLFFHKEVDLADVVFSKERVETHMRADEDRERNLVPVEEAITVTDKENLRRLVMNVVRGDVHNSLSTIALALDSEDSETAHYAASILQEVLNKFRANVQKVYQQMKEEMEKDEDDRDNELISKHAHWLIDYMDPVLKQQVFTGMEQKNQTEILDDGCEMLYTVDPESISSSEYEAVILRLLEVSEFESCSKWCERTKLRYPDALSTYTCRLKLYFSMGERELFFQEFNGLRESGIPIDRETLELIRAFL